MADGMFPAKGPGVRYSSRTSTAAKSHAIRVGFLPLVDAAPLIAASVWGDWDREGVEVRLTREIGWATIREKLIFGNLDAVQIPAPMAIAVRLGLGGAPTDVVVPWIINRQGNAITLSRKLRDQGVTDAASFGRFAKSRPGQKMTFGVVARHSMHAVLLHRWFAAAGLAYGIAIHSVVIPPAQMVRSLAEGLIDGFCAGEPWNAAAVAEGCGFCVAIGAELLPQHVEKVLLVREDLALNPEECAGLLRGLESASVGCDTLEGRNELVKLLQKPEWLGTPTSILQASLIGPFDRGDGRTAPSALFNHFHQADCNVPSQSAARSVFNAMKLCGMLPNPEAAIEQLPLLFREDLYREALAAVPRFLTSNGNPDQSPRAIALTSH